MNGEVPGTIYGMGCKSFFFLAETLSKLCQPWLPLVTLLDGHSSHFELGTIKLAKEKDVVIFCLPPHKSQPLDSCVFVPVIIVLIAIHIFLDTMQYF